MVSEQHFKQQTIANADGGHAKIGDGDLVPELIYKEESVVEARIHVLESCKTQHSGVKCKPQAGRCNMIEVFGSDRDSDQITCTGGQITQIGIDRKLFYRQNGRIGEQYLSTLVLCELNPVLIVVLAEI